MKLKLNRNKIQNWKECGRCFFSNTCTCTKYLHVVACLDWILLGKNYLSFNFSGAAALGWMLPHWTILLVLKRLLNNLLHVITRRKITLAKKLFLKFLQWNISKPDMFGIFTSRLSYDQTSDRESIMIEQGISLLILVY